MSVAFPRRNLLMNIGNVKVFRSIIFQYKTRYRCITCSHRRESPQQLLARLFCYSIQLSNLSQDIYPTTIWQRDDECYSWIFGGFSLTVHCFGERKKLYCSLKAIYILNTILIKCLFPLTCLYDNLHCVPFLFYPFVTLRQICFKLLGIYCLWAFFKLPLRKFILYIPITTTNFNYFKG